ncbi:MAG: DegT/DnrJ/EryC1/StrS family aminotransferase [Planktothrix sp.]
MRETFLVFASPQIHQAEIDEVVDSLKSGWLGTGPKVKRFQENFATYGFKHYFVDECRFKYNMTDVQAAIGINQLAQVEESWLRRQEIWQKYNQAFANLPLKLPADIEPETRHSRLSLIYNYD